MESPITIETDAMKAAANVLQPLSPDARGRVLRWLEDFFAAGNAADDVLDAPPGRRPARQEGEEAPHEVRDAMRDASAGPAEPADDEAAGAWQDDSPGRDGDDGGLKRGDGGDYEDGVSDEGGPSGFSNFAQLYDCVEPKTARQKVATAAWWLEEAEDYVTWRTFDVTKALKAIGRPLRYISSTINQEQKRDDPLVEQVTPSGDAGQSPTEQSPREFVLTDFGRQFVQGRIG